MNATTEPRFSIPSIIAIIAAIASFATGAMAGFLLAIVAVVSGVIGIGMGLLPSHRGGFASGLAIFGGLLGLIAAMVKAIAWLT